MERTNSISGRKYRDDATIFAWDLVNEPRCETWRVGEMLDVKLECCRVDCKCQPAKLFRWFHQGASALQVPECDDTMPVWINEMASFMKELDPNHLVTSGGEGFWGADNKRADNNPQMPASRCIA